ncbi:snRNA-activating protein complex subunit 2 [Lepisosteus oculatus]|uniref:snRNA-activating protein complex subunit 2 n=1 Tax=Lepisosteus oculatus TaxID=7918 RepID=UPI003710F54D
MKPPSRRRAAPVRYSTSEEHKAPPPRVTWAAWSMPERRRLLAALRQQSRCPEIDLPALQSRVPGRSAQEILDFLQFLKGRVNTQVTQTLTQQRQEQQKNKVPVELWADLAQDMAGQLEAPITAAFSQMLVIAATEPSSLFHSYPPRSVQQVDRIIQVPKRLRHQGPFKEFQNVGSSTSRNPSVPIRLSVSANRSPGTPSCSSQKPTPPLSSPVRANQTQGHQTSANSSPAASTSTPPSLPTPSPGPQSSSLISARPGCLLASSTSVSSRKEAPAPTPLIPSSADQSTVRHPTQTQGSGLPLYVNFEKLYRYFNPLSHKKKEPKLTALESAVMLDLLLSLPEELPLLDGRELQHHLRQVHSRLSSPAEPRPLASRKRNSSPGASEAAGADCKLPDEVGEPSSADSRAGDIPCPGSNDSGAGMGARLTSGIENRPTASSGMANTDGSSGMPANMPDKEKPDEREVIRLSLMNDNNNADAMESVTSQRGVCSAAIVSANQERRTASSSGPEGGTSLPLSEQPEPTAIPSDEDPSHLRSSDGARPQPGANRAKPDFAKAGLCPLNPFMIPLKLLVRSESRQRVG